MAKRVAKELTAKDMLEGPANEPVRETSDPEPRVIAPAKSAQPAVPARSASEAERSALREEMRLRENLGPGCPLCGMPCERRGKIKGRMGYYYCRGWSDPQTAVRYEGCGHSFTRRLWRPEEVVHAIDEGRVAEIRADAETQVQDRQRAEDAIREKRRTMSPKGTPEKI